MSLKKTLICNQDIKKIQERFGIPPIGPENDFYALDKKLKNSYKVMLRQERQQLAKRKSFPNPIQLYDGTFPAHVYAAIIEARSFQTSLVNSSAKGDDFYSEFYFKVNNRLGLKRILSDIENEVKFYFHQTEVSARQKKVHVGKYERFFKIYDLREQNPKRWSWRRLAEKFFDSYKSNPAGAVEKVRNAYNEIERLLRNTHF